MVATTIYAHTKKTHDLTPSRPSAQTMSHPSPSPIHGPSGMLGHYSIELWGRGLIDLEQLASELGQEPVSGIAAATHESQTLRFVDQQAPADGGPPPEWTIARARLTHVEPTLAEEVEQAVMQSWWFKEAAEIVGTCSDRLIITDHLHTGLDYRRRLRDLQRLTARVIEATQREALWWQPSQQFLHPRAVLESFREDEFLNPLPGGINVRYYEVPADDDSGIGDGHGDFKLMDTLGLGALGLTDFEIRYRGLDPEAVSQTLFNVALYLFQSGPVLRDGETVQGPGSNDRWLCTRAMSLSEPEREVWSIDPGAPFAVSFET